MAFVVPKASKRRLSELLAYLGDRSVDFKKCFNVDSKWCWKYADLVLRGIPNRKLKYAEMHHIVPRSFYHCSRYSKKCNTGNLAKLSYSEHMYAHYCAAQCALDTIKNSMCLAFCHMYNVGKKISSNKLPKDCDVLRILGKREYAKIRSMHDSIARIDAEGRTHSFDDPVAYRKELYELHREQDKIRRKARYAANHDEELAKKRQYYYENKEILSKKAKARYMANRDERCKAVREYRQNNLEKCRERERNYGRSHMDQKKKSSAAWTAANKERVIANQKRWREENKEHFAQKCKEWVENNREKSNQIKRNWANNNKDKVLATQRAYRERNKEKLKKQYEDKKAAGYRYRLNPATGKHTWVYVGPIEAAA